MERKVRALEALQEALYDPKTTIGTLALLAKEADVNLQFFLEPEPMQGELDFGEEIAFATPGG